MREPRAVIGVAIALVGLWGCECEDGSGARGGNAGDPSAASAPHAAIGSAGEGERGSAAERAAAQERLAREPTEPDPEAGDFTFDEAVAGLPGEGQLVAEISTDLGTLLCDLYADRAPRTVASFVGLARGSRPWWDASAGAWRRDPYYRGSTFHRVIPGHVIRGGDHLGDGTGTVGFTVPYEPHETLSHDRAGRLAMAIADGADGTGGQLHITDGPAPELDGTATVIGQCGPAEVVAAIARVPQSGEPEHRPLAPVRIAGVTIRRVEGGAAAVAEAASAPATAEPESATGIPATAQDARPRKPVRLSVEGLQHRRPGSVQLLREQRLQLLRGQRVQQLREQRLQ